jgi:hypothetical protein
MAEFKDTIRAAGGRLDYLFQPDGRLAYQISGDIRALYMVAVSMDGSYFLDASRQSLLMSNRTNRGCGDAIVLRASDTSGRPTFLTTAFAPTARSRHRA